MSPASGNAGARTGHGDLLIDTIVGFFAEILAFSMNGDSVDLVGFATERANDCVLNQVQSD
jgi:hypothetical protein